MKNILCSLFGHKSNEKVFTGAEYVRVDSPCMSDGIHRIHMTLYGKCSRCHERYRIGMIHHYQVTSHMTSHELKQELNRRMEEIQNIES